LDSKLSGKAKALHNESLVIDTHIDTATHLLWREPKFDTRLNVGHVDIPRLREGGVNAAFFAVWIDEVGSDLDALRLAVREIDSIYRTIEKYSDDLDLALTTNDLKNIVDKGKIAVMISIEGGRIIDNDLGILRMLHRLGVRSITLAWTNATGWVDSHQDEKHGGLTAFGESVVMEMQQIGMLVDISHVSDKSFWDVIKCADRPIFASHSCCKAVQKHSRNMTDEMIVAMAEREGVININFVAGFVGGDPSVGYQKNESLDRAQFKDPFEMLIGKSVGISPKFSNLIEHYNHAINLVGTEHVGIGTDYDGASTFPIGLEDISKLPYLTDGFIKSGYSKQTIKGILGLNNLKLLCESIN